MKTGGTGGALTKTGLLFEEKTDILTLLSKRKDYTVQGNIVYFKGKEVKKLWNDELSDIRRREIGFVFQDFYLMDSLSVEENIMLPLILDKANVNHCFDKARKYEKLFEISHLSHKNPYELSGGEKQRVAICRALVNDPDVIFADEPTGNLDSRSGAIVIKALENINTKMKKTIVMVTHNMQQAARISDRTAFFLLGEVVEYDETQKLFSIPQDKRTEDYITGRFG